MAKVYLGGPIDGCTDEEAKAWRKEASEYLVSHGHTPLDPMRRDYRGRIDEPGTAQEIVDYDLQDIDASDLLFMNCFRPSVGTSMEVVYGHLKGKQVVAVIPLGALPSPWLVVHASRIIFGAPLQALPLALAGLA